MTYPGGKNGSGVYQRIINHMPPHDTYIECFLGSGAVMRNKKPAKHNIAIDMSDEAISLCKELAGNRTDINYYQKDALDYLYNGADVFPSGALIYCDPPYVFETRKGGELYDHELTDHQQVELIALLKEMPCMVMLSGYRNALYDEELANWHRIDYQTMTRRGLVDESLWMNFPAPNELHDYSFLGENFRERERIKRKTARWKNKLQNMDRLERLALMDAIGRV